MHQLAQECLGAEGGAKWVSRCGVEALQATTERLLIEALARAASIAIACECGQLRASHLTSALEIMIGLPAPNNPRQRPVHEITPVLFETCIEDLDGRYEGMPTNPDEWHSFFGNRTQSAFDTARK